MDMFIFGTYHLQSILYLATTIISITVLIQSSATISQTTIPFLPLALYVSLSAPTSTAAGLYKNSTLRWTHWILYAIVMAYLLMPFQAYGAIRGLLSSSGYWH